MVKTRVKKAVMGNTGGKEYSVEEEEVPKKQVTSLEEEITKGNSPIANRESVDRSESGSHMDLGRGYRWRYWCQPM